ncbi:glycosyltransferase family 2 protein [Vibrio scophthalmi]|uniref:glycosyltransferase family 2 protein n=1 Tax=Vibrio scophthalmi TaxID=45658 RepID=UPI00158647B9|nr:glycosyltransferase [Vibrio scophthalmi]
MNDGIHSIKLEQKYHYIIVHQISNTKIDEYEAYAKRTFEQYNVKYVQSDTIGLSKSRNIGLSYVTEKFAWIMDDDVILSSAKYHQLCELIENFGGEFGLLVLNYTSNINELNCFQPDVKLTKLEKHQLFHIASINMLVASVLIDNGVLFDESFGLGTDNPSGEEFIFANKAIKLLPVGQSNLIASYHPPVTSGQDFYSTDRLLTAKLKMFIQVYGRYLGRIVFGLFCIKKSRTLFKKGAAFRTVKVFFSC